MFTTIGCGFSDSNAVYSTAAVWILVKLRQHSWNKRSKMRPSQFKFVRVSGSMTPTSPSRSSRRSGHNWSKGKKTSPCILVRLGLDGTKKSDKHEAIEDGKAKTMMSRTSPSILARLGLDKPKDEYRMDEGRTAVIERTTVDQRIPLYGSSFFAKQSPYLWYLPTFVRYPPVREPTGRLPPSSLLIARRATVTFNNSNYLDNGTVDFIESYFLFVLQYNACIARC